MSNEHLVNTRMVKIANNIKDHGYHIQHGMLSDEDIDNILNRQIPEFRSGYSDMALKNKLYRKREDTPGRLGDALMVSLEIPDTMPYQILQPVDGVANLYLEYIGVLGYFLGEELPKNTKALLNYQLYKEGSSNSMPFHFDAELFQGNWTKEYIELEEGLIPRMVMVAVLENENNGKGLHILTHDGVDIELNLVPGDIVYFDNTAVLHGVPEDLPKNRSMIGFRSFETYPLYFNKKGFNDGTGIIEINTPYVSGEAIELSTDEAKEMLKEQGWYY